MSINFVGQNWDVVNQVLNSTIAEVKYTRPIKDFWFRMRNDSTVYHRRRLADASYVTIQGGVMPDKKVILSDANAAGASLGFFNLDANGVDTIEIYVTY